MDEARELAAEGPDEDVAAAEVADVVDRGRREEARVRRVREGPELDPVVLLRGLGGVEGLEAAPVEVRDDDFDAFEAARKEVDGLLRVRREEDAPERRSPLARALLCQVLVMR